MKNLLTLFLFAPSLLFAQSRFDGVWEMKMETLVFSYSPIEYLLDKGMFHCVTCVPRVDVKADGSDQKLVGNPNYDTVAVRVMDSSSVEFVHKKSGMPIFACTEIVSPDGNTKTEEFSETPMTQSVTGKALFTRVAKGPAGSHALSGSWQMQTVRNTATIGPLTNQSTKDGLRVSAGGESYEAKLDGKGYPVQGDSAHGTISLRRIDDSTIEKTYKRDGKVVRVSIEMVSEDGKSMRVASTDIQRSGKTMTYTAEKRPEPSMVLAWPVRIRHRVTIKSCGRA